MDELIRDRLPFWIAVAVFAYAAWKLVFRYQARRDAATPFAMPTDVTLEPQALLSDRELLLYNMIRMAVQDQYLVFARVPLWKVLDVQAERASRVKVLRRMALKQVDFVLVHPGSRMVDQVIQVRAEDASEEEGDAAQRETRMMLQAAGIRVTTLEAGSSYSVQHLAMILGVSEQE